MSVRDNKKTHFNIHETREMNKHSLASFAVDKWNIFDSTAAEIIKKLEGENEDAIKHHNEWDKLHRENYAKFMEIADQTGSSESELLHQSVSQLMNNMYRDEEIVAFMEMKIIYAFRHLEINIKRLIASAYYGTPTKQFDRWENLETFFSSKSISFKTIEGYLEIDQLRIVNNYIKHSIDIDKLTNTNIPEFSKQAFANFTQLDLFYERIKKFPQQFLDALSSAIYHEQYEFNSQKISQLADAFALRMDKETAILFCTELNKCYLDED